MKFDRFKGKTLKPGNVSDRYKTEIVLYISSYIILIIMGGLNELFK